MYYSFDKLIKEIDLRMNTLHLYHLSDTFIGTNPVFQPMIPADTCDYEDSFTERICCCITIPGCFIAKEVSYSLENNKEKFYYLYEADVPVEHIYQPTINDVPDTWQNGEFWVLKPTQFKFVTKYRIRKHMDIDNSGYYSRYAATSNGYDEVVDRYSATPIYGDPNAFSYIAFDRVGYQKANSNQTIDICIPVLQSGNKVLPVDGDIRSAKEKAIDNACKLFYDGNVDTIKISKIKFQDKETFEENKGNYY